MPELFLYTTETGHAGPDAKTIEKIFATVAKDVDVVISAEDIPENFEAIRFQSLVHYSLDIARRLRLLNNKTIFLTTEETFLKISLILTRLQDEVLGAGDLRVSDVLDVYTMVKQVTHQGMVLNEEVGDLISRTALEYLKDLKEQNQIDTLGLARVLKAYFAGKEAETYSNDGEETVLFIGRLQGKRQGEVELCDAIFTQQPRRILREICLDTSFSNVDISNHCEYVVCDLAWEEVNELYTSEELLQTISKDEKYTLQLVFGYMRLLVNSRDELALSRVVSGPGGMLNHEAFTAIKKASRFAKMPMYQTMLSYVQKSRLNGIKDPESHPLFPYEKELSGFCDLMDKMQCLLEEQKEPDFFIGKLSSKLNNHITNSSSSNGWKMKHLDSCFDLIVRSYESISRRSSRYMASTPSRCTGNGGSLMGRDNLKAIRNVVDFVSATTLNTAVNLHKMLGMVEDGSTSEFETSLNDSKSHSPSAKYPSIISLFKSPEVNDAVKSEEDEHSLGFRLGMPTTVKEEVREKKPDKGRPKFGSVLAWAKETSPLVYQSPDREPVVSTVQDDRCTAPANNEPNDDKKGMLKKARHDAECALEDAKKCKKPPRTSRKRSILKEINRISKVEAMEKFVHPDGTRGNKRYIATGEENCNSRSQQKWPKLKQNKTIVQIKGQTKLTSFFRV